MKDHPEHRMFSVVLAGDAAAGSLLSSPSSRVSCLSLGTPTSSPGGPWGGHRHGRRFTCTPHLHAPALSNKHPPPHCDNQTSPEPSQDPWWGHRVPRGKPHWEAGPRAHRDISVAENGLVQQQVSPTGHRGSTDVPRDLLTPCPLADSLVLVTGDPAGRRLCLSACRTDVVCLPAAALWLTGAAGGLLSRLRPWLEGSCSGQSPDVSEISAHRLVGDCYVVAQNAGVWLLP